METSFRQNLPILFANKIKDCEKVFILIQNLRKSDLKLFLFFQDEVTTTIKKIPIKLKKYKKLKLNGNKMKRLRNLNKLRDRKARKAEFGE
jgi:hypothetical protein